MGALHNCIHIHVENVNGGTEEITNIYYNTYTLYLTQEMNNIHVVIADSEKTS